MRHTPPPPPPRRRPGGFRQALRDRFSEPASPPLPLSDEGYRVLVEHASEAIYVAQNGVLRFVNAGGERLVGYSRDELLARSMEGLVHPDDWEGVEERHRRRMRGEALPPGDEIRIVRSDGALRWIRVHATPITWKGRPATLNFATDITEQRAAAEALRRQEERFRLLVELQQDLVVRVDPEGRFLYANPAYCALFGTPLEDLLGQPFFPLVHPDDRAAVDRAHETLRRPPFTCAYEERALSPRGWRWLSWNVHAERTASGDVVAFAGTGRDVTERKAAERALRESEERCRDLVEFLPVGVFESDAHGNVVYLNRAALDLFRLSPEALERGLSTGDLVVPAERDALRDLAPRLRDREALRGLEHTGRRSDGTLFPMVLDACPLERPGAPPGVLGVLQDITSHREAEQRLHAAAKSDPLTGLENRRSFRGALEDAVAWSRQHHTPLALVFFDLDHFKDVNDRYGHPAGDRVLRHFGALLAGEPSGRSFRYGGEEFCLLLPDHSPERAWTVAERIRKALEDQVFRRGDATFSVTVSAGIAALSGWEQAPSARNLLEQSDVALYAAKRAGRNRTALA